MYKYTYLCVDGLCECSSNLLKESWFLPKSAQKCSKQAIGRFVDMNTLATNVRMNSILFYYCNMCLSVYPTFAERSNREIFAERPQRDPLTLYVTLHFIVHHVYNIDRQQNSRRSSSFCGEIIWCLEFKNKKNWFLFFKFKNPNHFHCIRLYWLEHLLLVLVALPFSMYLVERLNDVIHTDRE